MSTLFFELQNGISGDMTVAALLSLMEDRDRDADGPDIRHRNAGKVSPRSILENHLHALPLEGYEIEVGREQRNGIWGTRFTVHTDQSAQISRDYRSIRDLITRSGLEEAVRVLAVRIFDTLARAEAAVHDTAPEEVHFHEIGAVDSIVDIVSFSILFLRLGVHRSLATPVSLGSGSTASMHGEIPVPAPATVEVLKGLPVRGTAVSQELTTPTGAAILKNTVSRFGPLPPCTVRHLGIGFGRNQSTSWGGLRILEIDETSSSVEHDAGTGTVAVIEVTIDDSTPEQIAYLQELLFAEDALDLWVAPVHMKKGRTGFNMTVICRPESLEALADTILRESSSFGLRYSFHERKCLERETRQVRTEYGDVFVKIGRLGGRIVKIVPEYEDCRRAALQQGVSILRIFDAAKRSAHESI
jgi:uncharacterized protein (TIGR00299 family) protein